MRVISKSYKVRVPLNPEFPEKESYTKTFNHLQIRVLFIWITIDSEEVPNHVWISKGAFGDERTGWKSKFNNRL